MDPFTSGDGLELGFNPSCVHLGYIYIRLVKPDSDVMRPQMPVREL